MTLSKETDHTYSTLWVVQKMYRRYQSLPPLVPQGQLGICGRYGQFSSLSGTMGKDVVEATVSVPCHSPILDSPRHVNLIVVCFFANGKLGLQERPFTQAREGELEAALPELFHRSPATADQKSPVRRSRSLRGAGCPRS